MAQSFSLSMTMPSPMAAEASQQQPRTCLIHHPPIISPQRQRRTRVCRLIQLLRLLVRLLAGIADGKILLLLPVARPENSLKIPTRRHATFLATTALVVRVPSCRPQPPRSQRRKQKRQFQDPRQGRWDIHGGKVCPWKTSEEVKVLLIVPPTKKMLLL